MHCHFRVEVHGEQRAVVLVVSGELDVASSHSFEAELDEIVDLGTELVIVDLRELEFIDSTGLKLLVKANQRAEEAGQRFVLVKGGSQVQRLLSVTGLAERLMVVDGPEELLGGS